ncbi:uncharacterized protein LOC108103095 isoform X8 [Drosophila eugracilis]|uniref:uncharacterized protein LOC108103095 isoform X8 n=1 Tax=Drosophila eugracilis TaxID=29029 RepID=UPI001BDAB66E|nr:uncharacterized protein LOC108103095 isoform X8 [Drosophila eugracilis]
MQSQGQSQQLSQPQSAAHTSLQQNTNATGNNIVGKQNDLQPLSSIDNFLKGTRRRAVNNLKASSDNILRTTSEPSKTSPLIERAHAPGEQRELLSNSLAV